MRLRNIPGSREAIAAHNLCFTEESPQAGNWQDIFGNDHPIHIEIGMGKGRFLTALAELHPEINYVGIERYSSVLVRALEKIDARTEPLPNIRFIRMDATDICSMFAEKEVSRIYLNFSDPWPKDRHAKRRLTSIEFLKRYDQILVPDGRIEFKTDNQDLFAFSLEQAKEAGWNLEAVTRDLHHDTTLNEGNIMTEYEERFSSQGNPICKMVLTRHYDSQ
ncbi:MAG: tRNA (guanosine(46)-N7)-methyltransferase TrmB [Clostridiales bacterium]|nr:tRNA (guanosine(46)-N7)-methyltransferase TrmB [Clostridiales bacterium]